MLLWGASLGFFIKTSVNRSLRVPLASSPWQYITYMAGFGAFFHYFDWARRVALETTCENEEIYDHQRKKIILDTIAAGDEFMNEEMLNEIGIKQHRL